MPFKVNIPSDAKNGAYPERLSLSIIRVFWISIGITFFLSVLDLTFRISQVNFLSRLSDSLRIDMRDISAVCLILASVSLVSVYIKKSIRWKIILPLISGLFLIVVSSFTIITWINIISTGIEPGITSAPVFRLFLSSAPRMAMFSACIFFFIGFILILLISERKLFSNIAHYLCLPVAIASYIIPVSYVLHVHFIHGIAQVPSSLNSGVAFCSICLAIFTMKPDTRFMQIFASPDAGGIMARKLLPWLLLLPVIIAWFRRYGEHEGLYVTDVGILLMQTAYTFCFLLLVWITAKSVNIIDGERLKSNKALQKAYEEVESRIQERTSELLELNKKLDNEIRDRIKAEGLVEAERKRNIGLLEKMPAYMILLTPDYQVAYSNKYFREIFGESNGRPCYKFLFDRSEPCEICETYKTLQDNMPHTWEWVGPNNHIYSIYDFPYSDTDGSPLIMEMGIDVTQLKEAQTRLVILNAELEQKVRERTRDLELLNYQLNQELIEHHQTEDDLRKSETRLKELIATKDKFFSIIAHDLKNPFTCLLGSTEILLSQISGMTPRNLQELAQILNDSARSGYAILQNLLDWSRSQTGMIVLNPERIHLKSIIEENISEAIYSTEKKNINISSDVHKDLYVIADKNMLNAILRNLLNNAVKFTPNSGKVHVTATQAANEVTVSVKDTGIGIPESKIGELFRIKSNHTRPGTNMEQGTGLGLKICKDFVEMQGGAIRAESTGNEGSTFIFTLPVE